MTPSTYLMIGAGGTGSLLIAPLLRYLRTYHGEERFLLAVVDGDHVASHNLGRQMFAGRYVDENKAVALVAQYGDDTTKAVPEFLGDDNVGKHIRDNDVVMICADNYDVRARIERRALELENITVINGGNESSEGSLQVFVRRDGRNLTPPLSWKHPEILRPSPHDPSTMSCEQRTEIPGGEQTIVANMMSATQILNALHRLHAWNEQLACPVTREAIEEQEEIGEVNCPICGHPATEHPPESSTENIPWHEVYFDLATGNAKSYDRRTEGWLDYVPAVEQEMPV